MARNEQRSNGTYAPSGQTGSTFQGAPVNQVKPASQVSQTNQAEMPRMANPAQSARPSADATAANTKRGGRTALVVIGVVVLALAIWILVWLFACNGSSIFDATAQTGQAPYKTAEEMQAELDRQVEEGMFNISIASVIQFEDGAASGTAYIENVPGNRYNMQVAITDDDTGDVLYESGVLKPNQFIEDITLIEDLEPGTYPATATFKALDPTTQEETGSAAAKVTISVLG